MAVQSRLGVANEKLIAAIGIMETHGRRAARRAAKSPPTSGCRRANSSACSPDTCMRARASYYLKLRLDRARTMLLQTTKPILDVAVACGFASASHFSRCYRTCTAISRATSAPRRTATVAPANRARYSLSA